MVYDSQNIFAKILRGEIPCTPLYENESALAFADIAPKAPTHILVIPKGAYASFDDFTARASATEISEFFKAVGHVARAVAGVADSGFRLITNNGVNGGQEVPHFHVHILGGRRLGAMVAP